MKHKTGVIILIIGGICMIFGSVVGSIGAFEFLYDLAAAQWPDFEPFFNILINIIFRWIADLGGVAVIAGAIFIALGAKRFGKFIIWIGLAFGTIALIIWIVTQFINLTGMVIDEPYASILAELYDRFNYGSGIGFAGVVIAIIGRTLVRKEKPKKVEEKEEEVPEIKEPTQEVEEETSKPLEKKFCPECGTELPVFAIFCSNCGKVFD